MQTATEVAIEMLKAKNEVKLDRLIDYYQFLINRLVADRDSLVFLKKEGTKIHKQMINHKLKD